MNFKSLWLAVGLILFFTASAHDMSLQERAASRLAPMLQIVNVPFSEEDLKNPQNRALIISNVSEHRWLHSLRPRSPAQKQAIIAKLIEVFLFDPNEKVSLAAKRGFFAHIMDVNNRAYLYHINETVMSALSDSNGITRLRAVKLLFSLFRFGRKQAFLKIIEKALSDLDPQIRIETIKRLEPVSEELHPIVNHRELSHDLAFHFSIQALLTDIALTDPEPQVQEVAQAKLDISLPPVLLKLITALGEKISSRQRARSILTMSDVRLAQNTKYVRIYSFYPHNMKLAMIQMLGEKKPLLQSAVYTQVMEGRAYASLSLERKKAVFKSWKEKFEALETNRSLQTSLVKLALNTLNPSSRSMIMESINFKSPAVWKIIDQALSHPPNQDVQKAVIQIFEERGHSLPREAWIKFDFARKLKIAGHEGDSPFPQEEAQENIPEPSDSRRETSSTFDKFNIFFSSLRLPSKCKKAVLSKTE